jgi:hypothetical protein
MKMDLLQDEEDLPNVGTFLGCHEILRTNLNAESPFLQGKKP